MTHAPRLRLTGLAAGGILRLMTDRVASSPKHGRAWPRLMKDDSGRREIGAERGRLVEAACQTAILILEGRKDREAVLRRSDPLLRSTKALLRELARG
ncbi:MAG: hypothetical protein ACREQ9_25595 [Candidatus Binatia bacterium]